MRGDEARVVAAFERYLTRLGWIVTREVQFCDLMAQRSDERLYVEAKGRTTAPGLDVDTMYGQILRRMPVAADDPASSFAVVVPSGRAAGAALRVPERVREMLRVTVYSVDDSGCVAGPL